MLAYNIPINVLQNFAPMEINELRDKLFKGYENADFTNDDLVQIIERAAKYLNLKTISNYAKSNKITYNGALKRKTQKVEVDKVTFIIDNE